MLKWLLSIMDKVQKLVLYVSMYADIMHLIKLPIMQIQQAVHIHDRQQEKHTEFI